MPNANAIGTPIATSHGDAENEEDREIVVAEPHEDRARQPERRADERRRTLTLAARNFRLGAIDGEAQQREHRDQHRADRDRGRAPGIADVEAGRAHDRLVDRVLDRRISDDADEGGDHQQDRGLDLLAQSPGAVRLMNVVSRMCALRRIASTAPSTESQTNSVEASSSAQISGRWKK